MKKQIARVVALVISASLLSAIPVAAGDSDPDPSFNGLGVVVTDYDEFDQINDIAIQPDGMIVAVGHSGTFSAPNEQFFDLMVARYNNDGSLDSGFGSGGIVITNVGFPAKATAVALQDDGKIVVAATGTIFTSRIALVRYNPDGSLDTTFGIGGIVRERLDRMPRVMDLVIQSDGKIVVAGDTRPRFDNVATLARFNTDGSLDFDFGLRGVSQAGEFTSSPMVTANGIALQLDQQLVVAGVCDIGSVLTFCLSRHNPDGSLDNTFDGDGVVVTDFDPFADSAVAEAVSLQPDGKIVAAGQSINSFSGTVPALARFGS